MLFLGDFVIRTSTFASSLGISELVIFARTSESRRSLLWRPDASMTDAPPTTARHRVIAACFLMSVLLYLDRFCVSFAEVYIKQDLGLSEYAISMMFSAFFLSYALAQSASGWLADRFGGRIILTIYIVAWSLFTGLIGLANGIVMLVALRLGLGLAQAGAYPTAATLVAKWAPLTRRGLASSLVALGGRLGGVLSLFITGYVILYFTPIDVASTLTSRDILDADRLCYELVYGNRRPESDHGAGGLPAEVGTRILEHFPTGLRAEVEAEAELYRKRIYPAAAGFAHQPGEHASGRNFAPAELTEALNAVLRQPDFFTAAELQEVKLEHEARQLLRNDQTRLARVELERLNRLVLEAIYPAAIKRVYGAGWRKMMLLYGSLGLPVTLIFWMVCRNEPRQHPGCNQAELSLIERGRAEQGSATARVGGLPLEELVANRSMWCNGAMQFFTNVGWVFFMTYAPRYFVEVHSAPVAQRTWMSAIPTMAACGGMLLGGICTDPAVRWWGPRWGRSLPVALTRIAAGFTYLACLLNPSPWTAVMILAVTSLLCDLGIPAVWAFQQDVGGKYAGSVLGWGNMWGNFGAVVGPALIGGIVGAGANWNTVFITCAAAFILSGVLALGMDVGQKIGSDERDIDSPAI
jgi:MFS family permease